MPKLFLIKNATIVQKGHPRHLKRSDILVSDGTIQEISDSITAKATLIQGQDLLVSAGWHDMRVHLSDPGNEHKESLQQLCNAAMSGGFTSISTLPDSLPVIDNKSGLKYLENSSSDHLVTVYPMGTVSEGMKGQDLAEMYDMAQMGAVAFTDADNSINSGLLKKALLYVQPFNGLLISFALDKHLHHDGMVNESENTVHTGLKASPAVAEYSAVKQQLDILEYTGGRLHFSGISTRQSVALIADAKKRGLDVSCDVCILNLCYTDEAILDFDSHLKVMPLLRSEDDRKALIKGVKDGVIDVIVSNHHPQNIELKQVEFDYADFGAITIQQLYSMYNMMLKDELDEATFIECISSNVKKVLKLDEARIEVGSVANLTVADAGSKWVLDRTTNKSGAQNSSFFNKELQGKVVAVFNGNKSFIAE